ncbi:helix-turn-helix domain-containing protein [Streptomyces chartreusis]|uniref:helix-turn-helix domain-containing protein n=1 Tax=Streptomyces chartreusis TaxID=1969 RepID=UPI002E184FC8
MTDDPAMATRRLIDACRASTQPRHRLLTTAEAAELAGVTPACIRQWARRRYLRPVAQYGALNLYREDQVLEVERARRLHKQ